MIKYLIILLLIPCLSFGQMSSDTKHVYATAVITHGVSQLTYHITQRTGLSIFVGYLVGVGIAIGKEEIYDRNFGLGHPSTEDKISGWWGANLGEISYCWTIGPKMKRQREKKKFKKMNFYQH